MGHLKDQLIFIGTYTNLGAKGVYTCRLDSTTGQLTELSVATDSGPNPSFVAIHPTGRYVYSVAEVNDFEGDDAGGVYAYSIGKNGELSLINKESTKGTGPCHLVVEEKGRYLFVANYAGGSVAMFEVNADGSLNEACDFHQHLGGSNVEPSRQDGPHAHSVTVSPNNNQLIVCDLGLDKILVYDIDHEGGKLVLNEGASVDTPPGGGPRHFAFHPDGTAAFAINEIGLMISCYDVDTDTGKLTETHWVETVQPDVTYADGNSTADIHVSPDGKHIYGSNRGHNTLTIYGWDPYARMLYYIGNESTRGQTPRNFAIDPTGNWVLVANQDSGTIHTFRRDAETGRLTHTGHMISIPGPVCIQMMSA